MDASEKLLLSVVIPCYQQGRYLRTSMDSVLGHADGCTEVIVVDDGSTDDTAAVGAEYGQRIQFLKITNGGPSRARNAGARLARGEYLLFLDADDFLHRDAVPAALAAIETAPGTLVVLGTANYRSDADLTANPFAVPDPQGELFPFLINDAFRTPGAVVIPAQAFRDVGGFKESMRYCEDLDLWTRIAMHGWKVQVVANTGVHRRAHAEQASLRAQEMLLGRCDVLVMLHAAFLANPMLMQRHGGALAEAEHRVLRRVRTQLGRHPMARRLSQMLRDLRERGVGFPTSRQKQMVERVLGFALTEWIAFNWLRLVDRPSMRRYANGIL